MQAQGMVRPKGHSSVSREGHGRTVASMAAPSSPRALVSSSSDCRPLLEVSACKPGIAVVGGWV